LISDNLLTERVSVLSVRLTDIENQKTDCNPKAPPKTAQRRSSSVFDQNAAREVKGFIAAAPLKSVAALQFTRGLIAGSAQLREIDPIFLLF
jgi:hypothetical protein